jgi:hypothetical protein
MKYVILNQRKRKIRTITVKHEESWEEDFDYYKINHIDWVKELGEKLKPKGIIT